MIDKRETVAQYTDWLKAQEWSYFATFTTSFPLTLKSARRLILKLADKTCPTQGDLLFWVAERFEVREGYHMHALVKSRIGATEIWSWWKKRYGRAQVLIYDPNVGGAGYVAKYVTKSIADYDLEVGCAETLL